MSLAGAGTLPAAVVAARRRDGALSTTTLRHRGASPHQGNAEHRGGPSLDGSAPLPDAAGVSAPPVRACLTIASHPSKFENFEALRTAIAKRVPPNDLRLLGGKELAERLRSAIGRTPR